MTAKHSDMVKVKTAIQRLEEANAEQKKLLEEISAQVATVYRVLTR